MMSLIIVVLVNLVSLSAGLYQLDDFAFVGSGTENSSKVLTYGDAGIHVEEYDSIVRQKISEVDKAPTPTEVVKLLDAQIFELYRQRANVLKEISPQTYVVLEIPIADGVSSRQKRSVRNFVNNVKGFIVRNNIMKKFKIVCFEFLKEVGSVLLSEIIDGSFSRSKRSIKVSGDKPIYEEFDFLVDAAAVADGQSTESVCATSSFVEPFYLESTPWYKIDCRHRSFVDLTPSSMDKGYLVVSSGFSWGEYRPKPLRGMYAFGDQIHRFLFNSKFTVKPLGQCLIHDYVCLSVLDVQLVRSVGSSSGCNGCSYMDLDITYVGFKIYDNYGVSWCKQLTADPYVFFSKYDNSVDDLLASRCVLSGGKRPSFNRCSKLVEAKRLGYKPFYFQKMRRRINVMWQTP